MDGADVRELPTLSAARGSESIGAGQHIHPSGVTHSLSTGTDSPALGILPDLALSLSSLAVRLSPLMTGKAWLVSQLVEWRPVHPKAAGSIPPQALVSARSPVRVHSGGS